MEDLYRIHVLYITVYLVVMEMHLHKLCLKTQSYIH